MDITEERSFYFLPLFSKIHVFLLKMTEENSMKVRAQNCEDFCCQLIRADAHVLDPEI